MPKAWDASIPNLPVHFHPTQRSGAASRLTSLAALLSLSRTRLATPSPQKVPKLETALSRPTPTLAHVQPAGSQAPPLVPRVRASSEAAQA